MAWTTPATRSTGFLVTAAVWNADIKDNLRYLKGLDGTVLIENTLTIGAADTNLYRSAADTLTTDDLFMIKRSASDNGALATHAGADSVDRFGLLVSGLMEWGSGSATRDTNLYRAAADVLKTDDQFKVGWNEGTATDTGLFVVVNGTEKRIIVGAADSGGTGYKMLRILN